MQIQPIHLFLIMVAAVFLFTVIFCRILIPKLRSLKMGQKILDIGPRWHKSKEGTPTMGGLSFIGASVIGAVVILAVLLIISKGAFRISALVPYLVTLLFAIVSGMIGIIDDSVKITKKQNAGLTAPQKFLLQVISAALYLFVLHLCGIIDTTLHIPFLGWEWEMGIFYYVVVIILITGVVNSVNLTDGIDGLASTETFVVGIFFAVVAHLSALTQLSDGVSLCLSLSAATAIGASLGFLVYNFYPARVFMGDTGSLFFGALVVGMSLIAGNPLLILFAGLMYIAETASVILQTLYFKYTRMRYGTGKRIFKMSPIHHHFEMCGWSEIRVVSVFGTLTAVSCLITFLLEYVLL